MVKSKYKAVIFDLDDTLLKSREIKWAHHKAAAKKFYDVELTDEDIREHWGKPMHLLLPGLYRNADTAEILMDKYASIRDDFRKDIYEGSLDIVNLLLEQNVKVGILSAATKWGIEDDLARFNFPIDRLSVVQGGEDTTVHKPHPDVFLPLLEKLKKEGIEKENIVYVGDSLDDLRAAVGAGIDFIALTTGLYSEEDFKKHGARVVVKNIKDVSKFLAD